jgi:hypothetical protein
LSVVGAWKAIREEFEDITNKGCDFHFCQEVFRKVTELGFKTTYSQRGAEYRYNRSLMALPFLPSADIPSAFDQLAPRASSTELKTACTLHRHYLDIQPHMDAS